jgi:cytochrome c oxidase subunit 2
MLWIAAAVFVVVIGTLLYGTFRRRPSSPEFEERPTRKRGATRAIAAGAVATLLILFVYLVFDFSVGHALGASRRGAFEIELIGHRWWWEVRYLAPALPARITTANEIHIPAGAPVLVRLKSNDVIHSLWVPDLTGKRDLIPGKRTSIWLQAATPGVYRGQCAEFCGQQHAKMALLVVADSRADFDRWYAGQVASSAVPTDSVTMRGRQVFLENACALCHAVRGTPAAATIGPDLTHLASRRTIGAGLLHNTRGNLAGWVLDAQSIKPGVDMPPNHLTPGDLQALLAYLETLR